MNTISSGQWTIDSGQLTVTIQYYSAANRQLSIVNCQLNNILNLVHPSAYVRSENEHP